MYLIIVNNINIEDLDPRLKGVNHQLKYFVCKMPVFTDINNETKIIVDLIKDNEDNDNSKRKLVYFESPSFSS